jgi:hypothetical protein
MTDIQRPRTGREALARVKKIKAELAEMSCIDCGMEAYFAPGNEYYMVHDEVWTAAGLPLNGGGMLCIGCLEQRLGRELTLSDFPDFPVNRIMAVYGSLRLRQRMGINLTENITCT